MRPSLRFTAPPGAALVIVIVLVAMLMVLIVAFFSLSRFERRASRAYAQTVTSDVLSESALNTVIAQIRDATSNLGTTETWASQPGMLRRYDDSGKLVGAYKLYSSGNMVEGSSFDPDGEVPPGDWQIREVLPYGFEQTFPFAGGHFVQLGLGEAIDGLKPALLRGRAGFRLPGRPIALS